jgi:toxin ParE1/3/4
MVQIRLLTAVVEDVIKAAGWYDHAGHQGLGERFLSVFYTTLRRLKKHRYAHRLVFLEFRRVLLRPFPYWMFYRCTDDLIVVTLVIHTSQNPRRQKVLLKARYRK